MRLDQALDVKIGDHLVDTFAQDIVITNIFKDNGVIVFSTIDTRLRQRAFSYENVYLKNLSPEDICDEELSFIYWARDNRENIEDNLEHFDLIKQSYMQGFGAGFAHRRKVSHLEQMQK